MDSEGYIERPAPTKNWKKRDVVRSSDRSTWSAHGPDIQDNVTNHDLIQTSEQGRAAVAADLNGDGFDDLLVTNMGGYDSRSSTAVNLKTMLDGRPQVVPPPDNYYPTLTNFEPGQTRVFMNRYSAGNWLAVRLIDDRPDTFNRQAIGARAMVDDRLVRVARAGSGGFTSNHLGDLRFGLADGTADKLVITWPDSERTVTEVSLEGRVNGTLVVQGEPVTVFEMPR